jgi:tetratricopeptide (TPR) repeat protein
MSQLFRGRGDAESNQKLERELASLEEQTRTASPGYETQFLNRAGNLCVETGMPQRALAYFGRAIDAYLESGRFSAAEVLCRKVLRIAPEAVRARCTLAWLAIGKGIRTETEEEITDYVRAAQRAGKEGLAARQLVMMAEAATRVELRERLAEHLLEIGSEEDADRVLGAVFAERNGLRPPPPQDEGKLWAKLLRAALMGPQELKDQRPQAPDEPQDSEAAYLPSLRGEGESG